MFALTSALAACLLFLIQPTLAKLFLPTFGGAASVWLFCLLFFQTLLLLGYGLAHYLAHQLSARRQCQAVQGLLGLATVSAWLAPLIAPAPSTSAPGGLLLALSVRAGLPCLLLATSSPLLAHWRAQRVGGRAWQLYSLSNTGSLLGLLLLPALLEPAMGLHTLQILWRSAFTAWALSWGALAQQHYRETLLVAPPAEGSQVKPIPQKYVPVGMTGYWLTLSGLGALLLAVSGEYLSQTLPGVPFVWILPLTLYLLSFILAFALQRLPRAGWVWLTMSSTAALACAALTPPLDRYTAQQMLALLQHPLSGEFWQNWRTSGTFRAQVMVPGLSGLYLLLSLGLNIELVRVRPTAKLLTRFYLTLALGSVLTTALVDFVATRYCTAFDEIPLSLILLALLATLRGSGAVRGIAILCLALCTLFAARFEIGERASVHFLARNFYGVVRIKDEAQPGQLRSRVLYNGSSEHGSQALEGPDRAQPPGYYGKQSGVGAILGAADIPHERVGVVGLGVGALAYFGRPGDQYRFYEINPLIIDVARTQFTYLANTQASVSIIEGDGRLMLAREPASVFDVLIIDAFNNAQIPVHLLTREALSEYLGHLTPHGLLVFHTDSLNFALNDVVAANAALMHKRALLLPGQEDVVLSMWAVVGAEQDMQALSCRFPGATWLTALLAFRPWTDDATSLLEAWYPTQAGQLYIRAQGPAAAARPACLAPFLNKAGHSSSL